MCVCVRACVHVFACVCVCGGGGGSGSVLVLLFVGHCPVPCLYAQHVPAVITHNMLLICSIAHG